MASLGQGLREAREARHISIEEIASSTKIVPRYLEALENDHLEIMPGGFFIKGIIRAYAKAIGLDGEEVLAKYKAAELLGEPERRRHIFQKAPAEPAPPLPPSFVTPPPAEPAPSPAPEAEPAPAPKAATPVEALPLPDIAPALGLLIEPAPPQAQALARRPQADLVLGLAGRRVRRRRRRSGRPVVLPAPPPAPSQARGRRS